jgi:hypothetical protein
MGGYIYNCSVREEYTDENIWNQIKDRLEVTA